MAKRLLDLGLTEEELIFRMEHSQAILDFASLEEALGRVLLTSSQTLDDGIAVKTGFVGIQTFRAKLEFADRYLRIRYKDAATIERWEATRVACENAAGGRNSLAHWPMVIYPDSKPGMRTVLAPPLRNPRKLPQGHEDRFLRSSRADGPAPPESIGIRRVNEIRAVARFAFVELYRFEASANGMPDPLENLSHYKTATLATIVAWYRKVVSIARETT